jgi:YVTN family beta-propeller protein
MENNFTKYVRLLPLFRGEVGRGVFGRVYTYASATDTYNEGIIAGDSSLFSASTAPISAKSCDGTANARTLRHAQDDMQTVNYLLLIFLAFSLTFLTSCNKTQPTQEVTDLPISSGAVMFINEGNYTYGNASISYYNPPNESFYEDIYQTQNSRPLGDVAQSMVSIGGYGYVVVNNSNKIEVVDLLDFKNVATITSLTSPRYLLPLDNGRAYVSDIYGDKLSIINTNNNTITGTITLPGWTEQMVLANGLAFVANYDSMRVEVIDPATDTKVSHINVEGHPMEMVLDGQGQIWVLGQKDGIDAAALTRINPTNNATEQTLNFLLTESPSHLIADPNGTNLYYLNTGGIYKLASTSTTLPDAPIIAKGTRNYYAIGISPDNGTLYASDALDFNQRSDVYVFDLSTLAEVKQLKGGIITGGFYFYR